MLNHQAKTVRSTDVRPTVARRAERTAKGSYLEGEATLAPMGANLSAVETRLLSILERGANSALADGRAEVVVTTERKFWDLPEGQGDGDRMLGLLPKASGAARVGVLDGASTGQVGGWHLFVGDGPHFEFWQGTEADYQHTELVVRAAVQGNCKHWWTPRVERAILRPWRTRTIWTHHAEITLPNEVLRSSYEGGDVLPRAFEPLEFTAVPY